MKVPGWLKRKSHAAAPPPVTPVAPEYPKEFVVVYKNTMLDFDVSFTLESERTGFHGECGVGTALYIPNLPGRVKALDVWLFEKTAVKTSTIVFLTPDAFADKDNQRKVTNSSGATPLQAEVGAECSMTVGHLKMVGKITAVSFDAGCFKDLTMTTIVNYIP